MKKNNLFKSISLFAFLGISSFANAQGWVGNSASNDLYPVSNTLSLTPLKIGIGTNTPSAQLHTNGTVRFQGVTQNDTYSRILATDNNGNVFWRDAKTIAPTNFWSLTGNAGNNPNVNFLGNIDNVPLGLRVNNVERIKISTSPNPLSPTTGVIQLGSSTNPALVNVLSKDICGATLPMIIEGNVGSMNYNPSAGANNTLGRLLRFTKLSGTTQSAFYDIGINKLNDLYFTNKSYPIGSNPTQLLTLSSNNGYVGINMEFDVQPTANLHSVGTVRLQNLPPGTGRNLVVDAQGNVYVSNSISARVAISDDGLTEMQTQLSQAQADIAALKTMVSTLQQSLNPTIGTASSPALYGNTPNPTSGDTEIAYFLPVTSANASIVITNLNGELINTYALSQTGNNKLTISTSNFTAGTYIYSLVVGGKVYGSNKMVIQ
jgi:hypothetical protein